MKKGRKKGTKNKSVMQQLADLNNQRRKEFTTKLTNLVNEYAIKEFEMEELTKIEGWFK